MDFGGLSDEGMRFPSFVDSIVEAIADVDESLSELRDLPDFSLDTVNEIAKANMPDRISDTLAIESIMVNRRVTTAVLQGNTLSDLDHYTERAILNIHEADGFIEKVSRGQTELTSAVIRRINEIVVQGLGEVEHPGEYRRENVTITGADHQPPWWQDVPDLLDFRLSKLSDVQAHPIEAAAYAHWVVASVHPFENGNGRTARMVQDLVLISNGYLPVGVPQSKRAAYYDALSNADNGDGSELVRLICSAERESIERAIAAGKAQKDKSDVLARFVQNAKRKTNVKEAAEYSHWSSQIEALRSDLVATLRHLNSELNGSPEFKLWPEPIPTESEWRLLANADRQKWHQDLLRMEVYDRKNFILKACLFVKRHDMRDVRYGTQKYRDSVAAFIDIREEKAARFEFGHISEDQFVTMREVLVDGKDWVLFSHPRTLQKSLQRGITARLTSEKWEDDTFHSVSDLTTMFIEQLMHKLGIE